MKNPFFASRPEIISEYKTLSTLEFLRQSGGNLGNLLFFSAARRVIKHEVPSSGFSFDPIAVRNQYDSIIIPAANWLTSKRDLGGLASLIEKADLPTIVLGLGAQSFKKEIPELPLGTKRFLKAVGDRCHSLSVRGAYTAEVVANAGIKNINVTGCPSLLWNIDRPAFVERHQLDADTNSVSINSTRFDQRVTIDDKNVPSIGMRLVRIAKRNRYDFVAQTEEKLLAIARHELAFDEHPSDLAVISDVFGEKDAKLTEQYIRRHVRFFSDAHAWIDYMRDRDLSIGMRLHGVIAALIAGRPGILITHDTRTEEMAKQASIPCISSHDLQDKKINIHEIYESADFNAFNVRQKSYYENFRVFFEQNAIETWLMRH